MVQFIAPLVGAAASYLGNKKQSEAASDASFFQMALMGKAGKTLASAYQDVIDKVGSDPSGYAGSKVKAAEYQAIDPDASQRAAVAGNMANSNVINDLVTSTNQATTQNDIARILGMAPEAMGTLGNLSGAAESLSAGQLPFDAVQDIISNRSSLSGAVGTPGGGGAATLRDLGMNSLDAINQGASLFQQVLQGAESISPMARQIAAPQFYQDPNQRIQTDMQQALLDQQSRQNANNLNAAPDPGLAMQSQLQLAAAQQQAGITSGNASLVAPPMNNYASTYGQVGNALGGALAGMFSGQASQPSTGFQSGFGAGQFNPSSYNANALQYNMAGAQYPKAYIV